MNKHFLKKRAIGKVVNANKKLKKIDEYKAKNANIFFVCFTITGCNQDRFSSKRLSYQTMSAIINFNVSKYGKDC